MTNPPFPLSVLIVDDSHDCAESLAELLRAYGYEARTAFTPTEAMSAAATFPPDAVLLDIGMPGMDGYRLAGKLCERLTEKPMLVAITGFGNMEERSQREGFDHHFLKPVDPGDLVRVLAAHNGRGQRLMA